MGGIESFNNDEARQLAEYYVTQEYVVFQLANQGVLPGDIDEVLSCRDQLSSTWISRHDRPLSRDIASVDVVVRAYFAANGDTDTLYRLTEAAQVVAGRFMDYKGRVKAGVHTRALRYVSNGYEQLGDVIFSDVENGIIEIPG